MTVNEYVVGGLLTTIIRTPCRGHDGVVPDGYKREAFLKHLQSVSAVAERYAFAVYPLKGRELHWSWWESWEAGPFGRAGGHWITELVIGTAADCTHAKETT